MVGEQPMSGRFEEFPDGFAVRPVRADEVAAVTAMLRAAELVDRGQADMSADDVAGMWRTPGFDLEQHTCSVWHDDHLVAYAEIDQYTRAEAGVHPDWRGRGLGSALLDWTEAACLASRPPGTEARMGQTICDANERAIELFRSRGYEPRHTSWVLELPDDVSLADRTIPEGYRLRPFAPGADDQEVHMVIEDAFNEWPNRAPTGYQHWRAITVDRGDFDPSLLTVAEHDGAIIGTSVGFLDGEDGFVDQLAVRRDHRNRGVAAALLADSFGRMRERGATVLGLSTDSRTGALDLYLRIGMVVTLSFTHYSKLLRLAS
jgi:GNAT superfamily N-acetyltransferase